MKKYIFKNHRLLDETQAQISIHERGFLFGDGIFETCKIFNGKIYDFAAHKKRIEAALQILKFSAELSDLENKSYKLIKKNVVKNGILRISISRGVGSVGYLPTHESKALIIIETLRERELPKEISLGISKIISPKIPFKSMNSLPYVMNKIAAFEEEKFDLVMLSEKKFIAETSSANIFWIKNGKIFTPHESCNIVLGCVRKKLLKMSELKIKEAKATLATLKNADEIFLTNSSFLLLCADEFAGKKLAKTRGSEIRKLLEKDLRDSCR